MKRQSVKTGLKRTRKSKSRSISPHLINNHLKTKENKENITSHRKADKENQETCQREQQSMKICLELASHHRKEAEELKVKNDVLQYRLREQLQDMEQLRKDLNDIKSSLHNSHPNLKKQIQSLKIQKAELKSKIVQLQKQNQSLKMKGQSSTESIIINAESKCEIDANTLPVARESRRQRLANNYQSFMFIPSTKCLECQGKNAELQQQRSKYCNQLRQLQQQVGELQRTQIMVGVLQNQIVGKNQCIDFLRNQLDSLENSSRQILDIMIVLEQRLQQTNTENNLLRGRKDDWNKSFSKTVA